MKNFLKGWLGGTAPAAGQPKPCVEPGRRVYCIGDIHGRLDLLQQLHGMIVEDGGAWQGDRTLVYLGDYIDRGMHSREVVEELLDAPLSGFESVYLLGNHEQTLLDFLQYPKAASGWLAWGGRETLASYGIHVPPHVRPDPEQLRDDFTESRQQHEHVVVHGHTVSEEVAFHSNRVGIDTGAYATGILTCLVLEGEERRWLQTGGSAHA